MENALGGLGLLGKKGFAASAEMGVGALSPFLVSKRLTKKWKGKVESSPDPIQGAERKLLRLCKHERTDAVLEQLVELTNKLAGQFFSGIPREVHTQLARVWQYRCYPGGATLCEADQETNYFFIILAGSVLIEEPKVSHFDIKSGNGSMCQHIAAAGECQAGFGHYPLITDMLRYGYTATVPNGSVASVLVVPKRDYVISGLQSHTEKRLKTTVSMLAQTEFFKDWSLQSINRLFFWFTPKRLRFNVDVLQQGDPADFCFVLGSGKCEIFVEVKPAAQTGGAKPAEPPPKAKQPAEKQPAEKSAAQAGAPSAEGPRGRAQSMPPKMRKIPSHYFKMMAKVVLNMQAPQIATPEQIERAAMKGTLQASMIRRQNERHIVSLYPGAIIGEIALFDDKAVRNASVRTSAPSEILVLNKEAFFHMDEATLNIILSNANFKDACTKAPDKRAKADVDILHQRTAHLAFFNRKHISHELQRELCRVMVYRKVDAGKTLMRRGDNATCFYVVMSGSVQLQVESKGKGSKKAVESRNMAMYPGDSIAEQDLLSINGEEPLCLHTAVTLEKSELMEFTRVDFERLLKEFATAERDVLIDMLRSFPVLANHSTPQLRLLAKLATPVSFQIGQLCLAHPPDVSLGPCSYSHDFVYLVVSGEARVLAGLELPFDPDADENKASSDSEDEAPLGPVLEGVRPSARLVREALGNHLAGIATLGRGECISDNVLMPDAHARWCLQPTTRLSLLCIPRKEFLDSFGRGASKADFNESNSSERAFITGVPTPAAHKGISLLQLERTRANFFRSRVPAAHHEAALFKRLATGNSRGKSAPPHRPGRSELPRIQHLPMSLTQRAGALTLAGVSSEEQGSSGALAQLMQRVEETRVQDKFSSRGLGHILRSSWLSQEPQSRLRGVSRAGIRNTLTALESSAPSLEHRLNPLDES